MICFICIIFLSISRQAIRKGFEFKSCYTVTECPVFNFD
nr:MAG TPA: hypothetical protein [Caudoviricetes sp.]